MIFGEEDSKWDSRKAYVTVLISQLIGISNFNSIPNNALIQGTAGYTIFLTFVYIFMGIPILYMESVVGQFTKRDCIDVWKIRPCLSHMGYILILWQAIIFIYNHTVTSFLLHYLLISFENPIPVYTCGAWSSKYCNSLATNYTVNQDCIKFQHFFPYCEYIYKTFPEYQYWRQHLVRNSDNSGFAIAWRVCLASGLICFITYLACFKRYKSLKWFAGVFAFYPMLALMILMMGSMRQKGLVAKYEEALDLNFANFKAKFRLSSVIHQVVFNLNIGSGVMFTLASSSSFRSPCFSDIVLSIAFCTVFTIMFVYTVAMMTCPYAFEYGIKPVSILKMPMSFNFEKIPRFLYQYEGRNFYLPVVYSCSAILGICTSVIYFFNLLEVIVKRHPKLVHYPGLTSFVAASLIFIITIPFLSYFGVNVIAFTFRKYISLLSVFLALLECSVFIIWYGINKFAEDVHFMLGVKPKNFIKVSWVLSVVFLIYAFVSEVCYQIIHQTSISYGTYVLLSIVGFLLFLFVIRLLIAVCKKSFIKFISIDLRWGPNNDLLQRSRAMFSAQAMTKEYIYRQYSLQAGIVMRQLNSNKRVCYRQ